MIANSDIEASSLRDRPEVLADDDRSGLVERHCRNRCNYCHQAINWGQITEILGQCDFKVGVWIPLDPDEMQHECRRRTVATTGEVDLVETAG